MSFQNIDEISEALGAERVRVRDLYSAWEQRQPVGDPEKRKISGKTSAKQIDWVQSDLTLVLRFTECALKTDEFMLVCDAAREAIRHWTRQDDHDRTKLVRMRINYAKALTRLGFTRDARRELEPCADENFQPVLGRKLRADLFLELGNILREESHYATARAARIQTAEQALAFYQRALELDSDRLEALVLTAAAAFVIAEPGSALRQQAQEKARRIIEITKKLEDEEGPRKEFTRAQATANAVLGEIDAASAQYGKLKEINGIKTADLADARFYSQFLAEALGRPRDLFKPAFPPLELVVFFGHMPDLAGKPPRFPESQIEPAREMIRAKLAERQARVGLVGMAAGADLLFADEMLKRDGAVHLVMPCSQEEFRRNRVQRYESPDAPQRWSGMFDNALVRAATLRTIGQVHEPASDVGWEYIMEVTAGLALHTARVSRLDVQPMALWDGRPGRAAGGTANFVEFWTHQLSQSPAIISLPPSDTPYKDTKPQRIERPTLHQQVKSMLFADIVGYSKLTEQVIPEFIGVFMERVSQLAASSRHAPRSINTWGDAVYAIFDFAHDAGCFALELTQMIYEGRNDWLAKGLYWEEQVGEKSETIKNPLTIRVGLHTGPVFMHYDPIVRRLGFTGEHVNRAARIEPVAKHGEVFASEEFAALAELGAEIRKRDTGGADPEGEGFACEYAGSMELAKGYPGRFRIYRVLPKRTFAIEELALAAHKSYCDEARARGETPATNPALRPWEELPDDLRDANRAQVADVPNKLRLLGYELAPSYGLRASEIKMTDAQIEELSIREHDRWMNDRLRHGWTFAPERDNGRKHHPLLVPWDDLSEPEKEKDRDAVRNLRKLIDKAGFRVRKFS